MEQKSTILLMVEVQLQKPFHIVGPRKIQYMSRRGLMYLNLMGRQVNALKRQKSKI